MPCIRVSRRKHKVFMLAANGDETVNDTIFGLGMCPKQRTTPVFLLIDGIGIRPQHQPYGEIQVTAFSIWLYHFCVVDHNQKMKVVGHKAKGQKINIRQHVFPHFFKEVQVVSFLEKDLFLVVPLVEDVVNKVFFKVHNAGFW